MPMEQTIDALLEAPYRIIDILPERVNANSPGNYFAVERYYRTEPQRSAVAQKKINLVLKLNCYLGISLDEETEMNPAPERIAEAIRTRYVCIRTRDSLIVSDPDDTYLTVYNPDEALLLLLRTLAASEGLYLWRRTE